MKSTPDVKSARGISAVVCLMLVICVLFSLCSCKKNNADGETSSGTAYSLDNSSITDISDVDTADTSEDADSSDADTTSSEDANSSKVTQSGSSSTTTSAVQLPTATNPEGKEILGSGTKADPYLETPDVNNMSVTTVSIPAGKSVFYSIYRVGGKILTINSTNAYVVYNGTRYDANGGKVSFEIEYALASDAVPFEIGNKGGSAASFTVVFSDKTGSYQSPTVVKTTGSENKISLEEGDQIGHFYKYVAEKSGKLRFYVSATEDSGISVTNNSNSINMIANYAKKTGELTDPDKDDAVIEYIELEVAKGDEIIINVAATPNKRNKYPAVTITWNAKYA